MGEGVLEARLTYRAIAADQLRRGDLVLVFPVLAGLDVEDIVLALGHRYTQAVSILHPAVVPSQCLPQSCWQWCLYQVHNQVDDDSQSEQRYRDKEAVTLTT